MLSQSFIDKFDIKKDVSLKKYSRLQIGGNAQYFFEPSSINNLIEFIQCKPKNVLITVLGGCSNIIIRDGGICGIVIYINCKISNIQIIQETNQIPHLPLYNQHFSTLYQSNIESAKNKTENEKFYVLAEAGAFNANLSNFAKNNSLSNFEFLINIPGTIGGSIKGNSGCYSSSISDIFYKCFCICTKTANLYEINLNKANFVYRKSNINDNFLILFALFKIKTGNRYEIEQKMSLQIQQRLASQPINTLTCGSTFKNPPGFNAWQLIKNAGCSGLRIGGAVISTMHNNFIVNEGNATAQDIQELGELVKKRVFENSGINLEWEIMKVGKGIEKK